MTALLLDRETVTNVERSENNTPVPANEAEKLI